MSRFRLSGPVLFSLCLLAVLSLWSSVWASEIKLEGEIQKSEPFVGVEHIQIIQKSPRPRVINVLRIDPKADGVRFKVTAGNGDPNGDEPGDPNHETTRQTVRQFLEQEKAQAGINAAFYAFVKGTMDTNVVGLGVSEGVAFSPFEPQYGRPWPAINFGPDGTPSVLLPENNDGPTYKTSRKDVEPYNAISGSHLLVENGEAKKFDSGAFSAVFHPRTAAGHTAEGIVLLVTVDGRQPDFTEGASLAELAQIMIGLGASDAVNLDGGGSSTMVMADPKLRVVNNPSDAKANGDAGRERSNGVNIAVFAKRKPGYKPLPMAKKPAPPKPLPYAKKKIVIDDFEKDLGHFGSAVSACGSNRCIDKKSEAKIVNDRTAPSGKKALGMRIIRGKDSGKGLLLRFLSGGGATKNNEVLGRVGTIGYWIKTKHPNLKASIVVDDTIQPAKNKSKAHEKGTYRPIKADGKWHFYAWDLQKVHHWTNFYNGNGAMEGPNTSIDGLLITSDAKYNKQGEVIEIMVDAVTYDPNDDFE
ncbi:phosphodiester glycosidase family protein [Planctomycetota bacterium]|nr:phosphodiester glycosidase family protein [Planctomycetota bacterium]